ncbi:hypothetical protein ABIC16_004266 [Sphingomonas sp. PvP055]|uniref:hypothetical protein n=1 Tax=Sphingomonas sp. PvP055 TaxID=3156391 RepID=UPI003399E3A2
MPFSATVFNVLIASPSDVPDERNAIAQALHDWNSLNAQSEGMLLQPVMWETHSAPAMGDRPQGIINNQVVRSCDLLIGAFWTRLGSPTGVEESGTVEEIKWFLGAKKPVMLYYSKASIDPDIIDLDQYGKLKAFKTSIRDKGIQEEYRSSEELRQKLSRHLTIVMRDMNIGPVIDRKAVEAAKASTRDEIDEAPKPKVRVLKRTPKEDAKFWLEDYTEKAFVIPGDTVEFGDKLKEMGGKWMTTRDGRKAWMFAKRRIDDVAKTLKVKPILRDKPS